MWKVEQLFNLHGWLYIKMEKELFRTNRVWSDDIVN